MALSNSERYGVLKSALTRTVRDPNASAESDSGANHTELFSSHREFNVSVNGKAARAVITFGPSALITVFRDEQIIGHHGIQTSETDEDTLGRFLGSRLNHPLGVKRELGIAVETVESEPSRWNTTDSTELDDIMQQIDKLTSQGTSSS